MPLQVNFEIYKDNDISLPFTIFQRDRQSVQDITGWAITFLIKATAATADGSASFSKTVGAGITISGTYNSNLADNSQLATVTIADTDTSSLDAGTYFYKLKRTDDGSETTLATGLVRLVEN